ncbi:MAG: hypothetical protein QXK15_00285, partial [Candidatus Bathyarchaeia archaeon]
LGKKSSFKQIFVKYVKFSLALHICSRVSFIYLILNKSYRWIVLYKKYIVGDCKQMSWKVYVVGAVIIYILAFAVYAYYQGFP